MIPTPTPVQNNRQILWTPSPLDASLHHVQGATRNAANETDAVTVVTAHTGSKALAAIRADWERLTATDARYFMRFAFFQRLVEHLPGGADSVTYFVCGNALGEVTAIVPVRFVAIRIRKLPFRCAELVGSSIDDVSMQASSVDFPAASPTAAEQALKFVRRTLRSSSAPVSLLLVGRVAAQSTALSAALRVHNRRQAHAAIGGSKWLPVNRSFEELQQALAGKFRGSLRSSRRQLEQLGPVHFGTTTRSDPNFAERFSDFLQIEASGWKGRNGTATGLMVNETPHQRDFFSAIAESAEVASAGIHWLRAGDHTIASQLWLRAGAWRVAFKIGYLEEFARYQPGHLLTEYVVRTSCLDPTLNAIDFVSDAAWLDKWRTSWSPWHYHYLPVRPLVGMLSDLLLRLPRLHKRSATGGTTGRAPDHPIADT